MTKADLVEQVADAVGPRVTKRDCGLVVDAFLDAVKDALARGHNIEIRGFGTFKLRHRKARTARNPQNGRGGGGSTACCTGLQAVDPLQQPGGPGHGQVPGGVTLRGRGHAVALGRSGHDAALRLLRRRDGVAAGLTQAKCVKPAYPP